MPYISISEITKTLRLIGNFNQTIIARESNFMKRRIKEALHIQASGNGTLINKDKGTPINDSWKIFYQDIRKSMDKKMRYKDNS